MSYRWDPAAGSFDRSAFIAEGFDQRFDSQEQAEQWLSEYYESVSDIGVTEVTLMEEDRVVYGPMSLLA